jgi:tRNA (cmo5U34)-methyltransferase
MSSVGDGISANSSRWTFKGTVASTFDSHVSKSVPLYHESHQIVLDLSDYFVKSDSLVYDIGCSTGVLTRRLFDRNQDKTTSIIGIDSVSEMIEFAGATSPPGEMAPQFVCDDIVTMSMSSSDFVVMFYTLQFIQPAVRQLVVDKVYKSLNWGGAFVLFEKVRAPDARFQDIATGLYLEFKLRNGFELSETAAKTRSLKGVLEPFSSQGNFDLLKRSGFSDVMTISKYVCFEGFLAIK